MSQHDWRNWETCQCGEPGCRSSYPNRKWKQMNEDPIAAHLTELIADAPAPNHEEDDYDAGYVAALADLRDSAAFKLVVEQHTSGRIAELEATVARVRAIVPRVIQGLGRKATYIDVGYASGQKKVWADITAALEGEQR